MHSWGRTDAPTEMNGGGGLTVLSYTRIKEITSVIKEKVIKKCQQYWDNEINGKLRCNAK